MESNQPSAEFLYQLIGMLYTDAQMCLRQLTQKQVDLQKTQRELEEFTSKYHLQTQRVAGLLRTLEETKVCTCNDDAKCEVTVVDEPTGTPESDTTTTE